MNSGQDPQASALSEPASVASPQPPAAPSPLLQILYALEFLIALIATYTVWSQVGGQYHLDLMAWYWKLSLGIAISIAIVKATSSAVAANRIWNSRTLRWFSILLALALVCGAVTYYYHITEPPDDEEDTTPTSQTST